MNRDLVTNLIEQKSHLGNTVNDQAFQQAISQLEIKIKQQK